MGARRAAVEEGYICELGDDLMMNILSRLPSKSLGICRCVSKSWRRLVSIVATDLTPVNRFVFDFLYRRQEDPKVFDESVPKDDDFISNVHLDFLPSHPYTEILDCRDGFLLCSSKKDQHYVCNPITRQWVALPRLPRHFCSNELHKNRNDSEWRENMVLILDKSPGAYCFHFKVVRFLYTYNKWTLFLFTEDTLIDLCVEVYSSRTGKWSESKVVLEGTKFFMWQEGPPLFLDGVLYFLGGPRVLMYDVNEDYCKVIDLPDSDWGLPESLGEFEGCLKYACINGFRMKVWVMKGSAWVLKHNIPIEDTNLPELLTDGCEDGIFWDERVDDLDIIAFHTNSDAIFIWDRRHIFFYDFNRNTLETIMSFHFSHDDICRVYLFSECICPLADG